MTVAELRALLEADLARFSGLRANDRSRSRLLGLRTFNPRFVPVLLVRLSRFCDERVALRPLGRTFSSLNICLFGLEVTPRCAIGPGLMLPHTVGTVIGAFSLGQNVTIFQGVTLGSKFADLGFTPDSRPVVEDDVVIGAGAKVLGAIRIGKRAVVAANSLVTESVPPMGFAIGVPAQIVVR